ncbi:MAG: hypothetical protein AB1744_11250, partial [Candidatus Zixiibacteriota bacterium]
LATPVGREWGMFVITGGNWVDPKGWPLGEPWRDWDKPTDPRELAAYEHAHSLELPDSLPKPVPFDFTPYLLSNRRTTAVAYFEHLCATEAGEYIFKTVADVEGLYQMRAMPRRSNKVLRDRYGFEDPADWSLGEAEHSPLSFIGAPSVGFRIFESGRNPKEIAVPMYSKHWSVTPWSGVGPTPYWRYHNFQDLYDKGYTVGEVIPVAKLESRHAYTWRGLRRDRDREYGIAGGEMIVFDRITGEILGVRRSFAIARQYKTHLDWEFAYYCPGLLDLYGQRKVRSKSAYPRQFIRQVLKPIDLMYPKKYMPQGGK